MTDQQFCLRWNNFQSSITSAFETLREEDEFVDVTIACEGRQVQAHKMVLSACSPYFKSLLKRNPCQHPIIILKDVKYPCLVMLLDFMYHGEVNVANDQLSTFLQTAETLKIRGLAEEEQKKKVSLPKFPEANITPDTNHRERVRTSPDIKPPRHHSPPPKRKRMERTERSERSDRSESLEHSETLQTHSPAVTLPQSSMSLPNIPSQPALSAIEHNKQQDSELLPHPPQSPENLPPSEVSDVSRLPVDQVKEEPKDIEVLSLPDEGDSMSPGAVNEKDLEAESEEQFQQFASTLQDAFKQEGYKHNASDLDHSGLQTDNMSGQLSRGNGDILDPMQGGLPGPSGMSLPPDNSFGESPSAVDAHGVGIPSVFNNSEVEALLCSYCGKKFTTASNRRYHIQNVHFPRATECRVCGKRKSNINALRCHYYRTHKLHKAQLQVL